jgi:hypothetical protein
MFVSNNLALANRNLPDIIWCFVSRTRLAKNKIDVSVQQCDIAPPSSLLRLHSSSSRAMPSMECRGAVSVGTVLSARSSANKKKFLRPFEGVPGNVRRAFASLQTAKS